MTATPRTHEYAGDEPPARRTDARVVHIRRANHAYPAVPRQEPTPVSEPRNTPAGIEQTTPRRVVEQRGQPREWPSERRRATRGPHPFSTPVSTPFGTPRISAVSPAATPRTSAWTKLATATPEEHWDPQPGAHRWHRTTRRRRYQQHPRHRPGARQAPAPASKSSREVRAQPSLDVPVEQSAHIQPVEE